jgi:hypothetical protein
MTKNPCIKCEPLFAQSTVSLHRKLLRYQRDWFDLKVENNQLKDQIAELKELLRLHHQAKIELGVMQ